MTRELEERFVEGVEEVPRQAWDALVPPDAPFFEWTYLRACELDSAVPERGCLPRHLTLWRGEELVAACPVYLKGDGRGEFIYDFQWHVLASRMGRRYYPKAISMAPFAPATAPHFLTAPGEDRPALLRRMAHRVEEDARELGLSGVHHLFVPADEADALEEEGYLRRLTHQLVLTNPGWTSFEDYLGSFRAKHRIKLRREMRRVEEQGLVLRSLHGEEIDERAAEDMHAFYLDTCGKHGTGSDYLQPATWRALFSQWRHRLVVCFAEHEGRRVGGSLCVRGESALHGRYWGCRGRWHSLYFNLAFFAPLRFAIEHGIERFHAGFGNAPYKHARGFEPHEVHSAHRVFDPVLAPLLDRYLEQERELVREDAAAARALSRLRPRRSSGGPERT